jgi:peptide/nickel transport system substrate-binding protein
MSGYTDDPNERRAPFAQPEFPELTRRGFLRGAGVAGAGLSAAAFLAACGGASGGSSSGSSSASTSSAAQSAALGGPVPQTPKPGGTLRIGYPGNGTSETYSPALANTPIDGFHCYLVYDPLMRVGPNHELVPGLATDWQPNKKADVWELRLRSGVTWHDGKPFTADDVIYTLNMMGSPAHLGHYAVASVDLKGVKKLSDTLVRIPLQIPIADLSAYFGYINAACVVQNGAKNFNKPVGTGPYKLVSFTPGQQSTLVANKDYWDHPRPYPDGLRLLSINDDEARLNALESNQLDICGLMNFAQGKAGSTSGYNVVVGYAGASECFNMRVDQAPFTDVRVRQAMKLLINRPAMIESALSGFGTVLNDFPGAGFPHYDASLPQRQQDVEQAKSLLKAAGQSDIQFEIQTTDGGLGQLQAAEVLEQQMHAAGISGAQLKVQPVANYYNPTLLFTKMTFAQNIWAIGSLNSFVSQALLSSGSLNETHWNSSSFDQLYFKALGETNPSRAQDLWNQLQAIQYNQGGYIFWSEVHNVDGVAKNVAGYGGPGVGWAYPTGDQRVWDWGFAT